MKMIMIMTRVGSSFETGSLKSKINATWVNCHQLTRTGGKFYEHRD